MAYQWSSHASYLCGSSDLVDIDFLLGLFADNKQVAVQRYAQYMQERVTGNPEDTGVYSAHSTGFENKIKPEPDSAAESLGLNMRGLIALIASATGLQEFQVWGGGRARKIVEARNLGIYLAIKYGVATRCDLSNLFGISQSQVSRAYYSAPSNPLSRDLDERINNAKTQA